MRLLVAQGSGEAPIRALAGSEEPPNLNWFVQHFATSRANNAPRHFPTSSINSSMFRFLLAGLTVLMDK